MHRLQWTQLLGAAAAPSACSRRGRSGSRSSAREGDGGEAVGERRLHHVQRVDAADEAERQRAAEVREQHARVLKVPFVRMAEHEPVTIERLNFAREKACCGSTRRLIVDRADAGVMLKLVAAVGV